VSRANLRRPKISDRKEIRTKKQNDRNCFELHNKRVKEIYDNPEQIIGQGEIIWKARSPSSELAFGESDKIETVDIVLLNITGHQIITIHVFEVKTGTGSYAYKGTKQLQMAQKFFCQKGATWLLEKNKSFGLNGIYDIQLKCYLYYFTYMDRITELLDPLISPNNFIVQKNEYKLGSIDFDNNRVDKYYLKKMN
jgi:hypothetical protein